MADNKNSGDKAVSGWYSSGDLTRSDKLAALLTSAAPETDLLSWQAVHAIVRSAPPVHSAWYERFLYGGARQLRYGLASVLAFGFGTGLLAMLPAQSDLAGTLVVTDMPSAWTTGSVEMQQFEAGARESFAALKLPQAELYVLDVARSGQRPELALAMLNVPDSDARAFHTQLAARYPALTAFPAQFEAIDTDIAGSRLNELFLKLTNPDALTGAGDDEIRGRVLSALGQMGLVPTRVETRRLPDGTIVVEIDAQMSISVGDQSTDKLESIGLSRETLGDAAYTRLLMELGAQQ
jgi:hypothetical protein